jgi:hypothetical protein
MDELVDSGFVILGGPLDDVCVVLAVETESEEAVRATLARPMVGNASRARYDRSVDDPARRRRP